MVRHTISLSDAMSNYVNENVQSGQFCNTSEYFRDLIRRDQEQRALAIQELKKLVEDAEASGISNLTMSEIREKARKRLKL